MKQHLRINPLVCYANTPQNAHLHFLRLIYRPLGGGFQRHCTMTPRPLSPKTKGGGGAFPGGVGLPQPVPLDTTLQSPCCIAAWNGRSRATRLTLRSTGKPCCRALHCREQEAAGEHSAQGGWQVSRRHWGRSASQRSGTSTSTTFSTTFSTGTSLVYMTGTCRMRARGTFTEKTMGF